MKEWYLSAWNDPQQFFQQASVFETIVLIVSVLVWIAIIWRVLIPMFVVAISFVFMVVTAMAAALIVFVPPLIDAIRTEFPIWLGAFKRGFDDFRNKEKVVKQAVDKTVYKSRLNSRVKTKSPDITDVEIKEKK